VSRVLRLVVGKLAVRMGCRGIVIFGNEIGIVCAGHCCDENLELILGDGFSNLFV